MKRARIDLRSKRGQPDAATLPRAAPLEQAPSVPHGVGEPSHDRHHASPGPPGRRRRLHHASYADELGGGSVQVLGVGTCGPDVPGKRTYHLAWTAAVAETGHAPERLLGSFELTFERDEWRITLWYLDTLELWNASQTDPLTLSFCEADLHPWVS